MNLRTILVTIICFCTLKICAQNITGNVVDEKQQVLSFANIVLLKADSTYIAGTIADDAGSFSISRHHDAKYLNVSYIGYAPQYLEITADNIGTIQLQPDASMLGEVVVVGSRPVIKRDVDRLVFDVEATPLSQGSNAFSHFAHLQDPSGLIETACHGFVELFSAHGNHFLKIFCLEEEQCGKGEANQSGDDPNRGLFHEHKIKPPAKGGGSSLFEF